VIVSRAPWVKCDYCGRYAGQGADQGTTYGNCTMPEPPEPTDFCRACSGKQFQRALEKGLIRCWWIKPNWYRMAASVLRHRDYVSHLKVVP